jgi:alanyl-tRNA synthetase
MNARELRRKYLEFFETKEHRERPSDSLVPDDPSLLFTSAGMVQFKPYFLGVAKPPHVRLSSAQKCLRTTDIDKVGNASHLTFFEMLGNFSIGDYFKREAIEWAWGFLVEPKWLGLDPEKLCVTVFETDDEAFRLWREIGRLPEDRIHRLGEDKNYWPATAISEGPNGPCGPCTEIFYRTVPPQELTGDFKEDEEAGRWLEIWNLVFLQYERKSDPADLTKDVEVVPLPKPSVDTGMGLERTAQVLSDLPSVYHVDAMWPVIDKVCELSGKKLDDDPRVTSAARIITDHLRAACFCIADGVLPQNSGRGYVLRRLIRRAVLKGQRVLGFEEPFLVELFPALVEALADQYPELTERGRHITRCLGAEEGLFRRTLADGEKAFYESAAEAMVVDMGRTGIELSEYHIDAPTLRAYGRTSGLDPLRIDWDLRQPEAVAPEISRYAPTWGLAAREVFRLHDTFGFPVEVTQELVEELQGTLDLVGFQAALEAQRERSRASHGLAEQLFRADAAAVLSSDDAQPTVFVGYNRFEIQTKLVSVRPLCPDGTQPAQLFDVALAETPFYAEAGGEVGDTGTIRGPDFELRVEDTQKAEGVTWHRCSVVRSDKPLLSVSAAEQLDLLRSGYFFQPVTASIDFGRRCRIIRNHSATHLLHAALREVLGDHVRQAGSLVAPEHLRFDFTHGQAMTAEELAEVERLVNEWILNASDVRVREKVPIEEAKAGGAMALFGEKYEEQVRTVEVPGLSLELCGGCHVTNTAQIGLFKIVHESSAASGVRRIEAVTGPGACEWVAEREGILRQAASALKSTPQDLPAAIDRLQAEMRDLRRQLEQAVSGGVAGQAATVSEVEGVPLVVQQISGLPLSSVPQVADRLAEQHAEAVVLVGAASDDKVLFVAKASQAAVRRGAHAGNLVKEIARFAGGSGGGRAEFAKAGAKDPEKLDEALTHASEALAAQLKAGA